MIVPITMLFFQFRIGPLDGIRKTTASYHQQIGRHAERGYQGRKELSLRQPTLWKNLTHRKGKYV
jgi:hypothetical protein